MLILIAESKTMKTVEQAVSPSEFSEHRPAGEKTAAEIIDSLRDLTVGELAERLKLSGSLAVKMQKMIYEFPNKALGLKSIEAFTGVVFQALDFATLSAEARSRCLRDTRIISSLYGWLRPDDIVKPYRLDFNTKIELHPDEPNSEKALFGIQRSKVSVELVNTLNQSLEKEILDLLPGDAAKCVDWKLTKRFAKVWKVDFVELQESGARKTPAANKLKKMRGLLLRQILQEDIRDIATLRHVSSPHYLCEGTPIFPNHLSFLC